MLLYDGPPMGPVLAGASSLLLNAPYAPTTIVRHSLLVPLPYAEAYVTSPTVLLIDNIIVLQRIVCVIRVEDLFAIGNRFEQGQVILRTRADYACLYDVIFSFFSKWGLYTR